MVNVLAIITRKYVSQREVRMKTQSVYHIIYFVLVVSIGFGRELIAQFMQQSLCIYMKALFIK